jgi:hypothetical protein
MKSLSVIVVVAALAAAAACAKPAGGPLDRTFDNTRIASVGLDAKQAVIQAQQQNDLAQQRHGKAEDDLRDAEVEQDVAEYQAEHAVLVVQLVGARMSDKGQAGAETAALARRTAGAKVEFMRARHAWLRALASSTLYEVYATQARLELERARLAQSNGLTPAGFDLTAYQQQADQRDRAAHTASDDTERQRQLASAKLTAWSDLEKSFIQASGLKAPSESERAVIEWKQTEPSATPTPPAEPGPAPTKA